MFNHTPVHIQVVRQILNFKTDCETANYLKPNNGYSLPQKNPLKFPNSHNHIIHHRRRRDNFNCLLKYIVFTLAIETQSHYHPCRKTL